MRWNRVLLVASVGLAMLTLGTPGVMAEISDGGGIIVDPRPFPIGESPLFVEFQYTVLEQIDARGVLFHVAPPGRPEQEDQTIGGVEALIEEVKAALDRKRRALAIMTGVGPIGEAEVAVLKAQYEAFLGDLDLEKSSLESQRSERETALALGRAALPGLKGAGRAALQKQIAIIENQLREIEAKLAAVTARIATISGILDDLSADPPKTDSAKRDFRLAIDRLKADIKREEAKLKALEERLAELKKKAAK